MKITLKPSDSLLVKGGEFDYRNGEWFYKTSDYTTGISTCAFDPNYDFFLEDVFADIHLVLWRELLSSQRNFKVKKKKLIFKDEGCVIKIKGDFIGLSAELDRRYSPEYPKDELVSADGVPIRWFSSGHSIRGHDDVAIDLFRDMSIKSMSFKGEEYGGWLSSLEGSKIKFKSIETLNLYDLLGSNDMYFDANTTSGLRGCRNDIYWIESILRHSTGYKGPKFDTLLNLSPDFSHKPWYSRREGKLMLTDDNFPEGNKPNYDPTVFFYNKEINVDYGKMNIMHVTSDDPVRYIELDGFGSTYLEVAANDKTKSRTITIDSSIRTSLDRVVLDLSSATYSDPQKTGIVIHEFDNPDRSTDLLMDETIYESIDEVFNSGSAWDKIIMPGNGQVDITIIDDAILRSPPPVFIDSMARDHTLAFDTSKINNDIYWSSVKPCEDCYREVRMHYDDPSSPGILRAVIDQRFDDDELFGYLSERPVTFFLGSDE